MRKKRRREGERRRDGGVGSMPKGSPERRRRIRIPIRYKVLMLVSTMLLAALSSYLYLAVSLFTRDKLMYTFDLNSTLVQTLAAQVRAAIGVQVKEAGLLARQLLLSTDSAERRRLMADFFLMEPGYLRVELAPVSGGKPLVYYNEKKLEEIGATPEDLVSRQHSQPLSRQALISRTGMLQISNVSLSPDIALLRLVVSLGFSRQQEKAEKPRKPRDGGEGPRANDKPSLLFSLDFLYEDLLRIFGKSRTHETFMVDEQGRILAHPQPEKVISSESMMDDALVRQALAGKIVQGVKQYQGRDGQEYLGAFAKVGMGGIHVFTRIPRKEALRASQELVSRTILFGVAILLVSFLASIVFSRLLTAPVSRLSAIANMVGQGKFDIPIEIYSRDEIGGLARSFRQMVKALKKTQAQLVRSEKMAAFGQLGAGITHEVKNPMTGISGYAELALLHSDDPKLVKEYLEDIRKQSRRCLDILQRFLKFARQEDSPQQRILNLNELVAEAGKLVKHHALLHKVAVKVKLGDDVPEVEGNAGELQQVLLNLAMNAQQAMVGGGTLLLETRRGKDGQSAEILVIDTGPGIPPDIQKRIFDPFFTTKSPGEGTGLGLAIVYSIIKDHSGAIDVDSQVGQGTTFIVRLPGVERKNTGTEV